MNTIYEGMRVLDLADDSCAFCGKQLAAFGAEVVKIEPPQGSGDRGRGPFAGGEPHPEKSLSFAFLNTGKKDLTLNLETEEGRTIFKKLAKTADVIVETFEPGTMQRLGLDYETLKADNSGLIMVSYTPFGQTGPHTHWKASTDLITDAMGGPMADRGRIGQAPLHFGYDVLSNAASMYAVFAIQAAWHNRMMGGEGAYIDISQQECYATWRDQWPGDAQINDCPLTRVGGPDYALPFLRTGDGGLVFASIATKWDAMKAWFQEEGLDLSVFEDPFYEEYAVEIQTPINKVLMGYFDKMGESRTKTQFMEEAQGRGFPMAAVEECGTILDNAQLNARDYFVEMDHPYLGKLKYPGELSKMSAASQVVNIPAPTLGADTGDILAELGYTPEQVDEMKEGGTV